MGISGLVAVVLAALAALMLLVWGGFGRRVEAPAHCRSCCYELQGHLGLRGAGRRPPACPECGRSLDRPGAVRRWRRRRRPVPLVLGVLLLAALRPIELAARSGRILAAMPGWWKLGVEYPYGGAVVRDRLAVMADPMFGGPVEPWAARLHERLYERRVREVQGVLGAMPLSRLEDQTLRRSPRIASPSPVEREELAALARRVVAIDWVVGGRAAGHVSGAVRFGFTEDAAIEWRPGGSFLVRGRALEPAQLEGRLLEISIDGRPLAASVSSERGGMRLLSVEAPIDLDVGAWSLVHANAYRDGPRLSPGTVEVTARFAIHGWVDEFVAGRERPLVIVERTIEATVPEMSARPDAAAVRAMLASWFEGARVEAAPRGSASTIEIGLPGPPAPVGARLGTDLQVVDQDGRTLRWSLLSRPRGGPWRFRLRIDGTATERVRVRFPGGRVMIVPPGVDGLIGDARMDEPIDGPWLPISAGEDVPP